MTRTLTLASTLASVFMGCTPGHDLHLHVDVCGALVDDPGEAPDDFVRVSCAASARFRLLDRGGGVLDEQCVDLPTGGAADLFRPPSGSARRATLSAWEGPAAVEVTLLPAGVPRCADGVPLIAAGRSSLVEAPPNGVVELPLGARAACDQRFSMLTLTPFDVVNNVGLDPATQPTYSAGEIFAWDTLIASQGACIAPAPAALRGAFRALPITQTGTTIFGDFGWDSSPNAGCLAVRTSGGLAGAGATYSCLDRLGEAPYVPLLDAAHWQQVIAQTPAGAKNGALVIRVHDPNDTGPLAGVRVAFDPDASLGHVVYPLDDAWTQLGSDSTSAGGFAIVYDAPTGRYRFTGGGVNDDGKLVNAGTPADPASVTVLTVLR